MPRYKIAHIEVQNVDLILVPVKNSFHTKTEEDKNDTIYFLQECAISAGLAGDVIPVWNYGNRFRFIAPESYHPFLKSINMQYVMSNINRELVCE